MFENRREIMQDVFLTYLPAQHFKTSRLTLNLIAPLRRETASAKSFTTRKATGWMLTPAPEPPPNRSL